MARKYFDLSFHPCHRAESFLREKVFCLMLVARLFRGTVRTSFCVGIRVRRANSAVLLVGIQQLLKMSGKKIVDTFNEIDNEMIYIKNKLDSLAEVVSGAQQADSSGSILQQLKDENKDLQREMLEIMKQIAVYDILEGKPPLALKVFLQV